MGKKAKYHIVARFQLKDHNSYYSPLVSDKAYNSRHDYLNSSGIYDESYVT